MTRKPAGVGGTKSHPHSHCSLSPAPDQAVHSFIPRSFNVNLRAVIQVSQVSCPTRLAGAGTRKKRVSSASCPSKFQIVAKGMIARGVPGAIVNVSSQASQRALTNHTVYCE